MRKTTLPWILLIAALPLVGWPLLAQPQPAAPEVLDQLHADYLEDEQTGRRLADLSATLQVSDGVVRLRLLVSAFGPNIDPAPGFRGVAGANHVTALDLTDHFDRGLLRLVVMPKEGTEKRFGVVQAGTRARVPERRLRPDGVLDLHAKTAETFLVGIECLSPELPTGEHEIYLEAKGIPRLRVDVSVIAENTGEHTTANGHVLSITSLGDHEVRTR